MAGDYDGEDAARKTTNPEDPVVTMYKSKASIKDILTIKDLEKMTGIWLEKTGGDKSKGLNMEDFCDCIESIHPNIWSRTELRAIFMKIDENVDTLMQYDELANYIMIEDLGKDALQRRIGVMKKKFDLLNESLHPRENIVSTMFVKNAYKESGTDEDAEAEQNNDKNMDAGHSSGETSSSKVKHNPKKKDASVSGRYLTVSDGGHVTFWSMAPNIRPKVKVLISLPPSPGENPRVTKKIMVTQAVVLHNVNLLAIATGGVSVFFYDIGGEHEAQSLNRRTQYQLDNFDRAPLAMSYWINKRNLDESCLIIGDEAGVIHRFHFLNAHAHGGLFGKKNVSTSGVINIDIRELKKNPPPHLTYHRYDKGSWNWIRQLEFYKDDPCSFIVGSNSSGSNSTTSAKGTGLSIYEHPKRETIFAMPSRCGGATCIAYSKIKNAILTGSSDHVVRMWNTYVPQKSASELKGHHASIVSVLFDIGHGDSVGQDRMISISLDGVVIIWSYESQSALQTILDFDVMASHKRFGVQSAFWDPAVKTLFVGTNCLMTLRKRKEMPKDRPVVTHECPIAAARYNPLFNQVVSACRRSIIHVWQLETAHNELTIANAHAGREISFLDFDKSWRKLITGCAQGEVRIWNYNLGLCLRILASPTMLGFVDVTGVVELDYCQKTRFKDPKPNYVVSAWLEQLSYYPGDTDLDENQSQQPYSVPWNGVLARTLDENDESNKSSTKRGQSSVVLSMTVFESRWVATASTDEYIRIYSSMPKAGKLIHKMKGVSTKTPSSLKKFQDDVMDNLEAEEYRKASAMKYRSEAIAKALESQDEPELKDSIECLLALTSRSTENNENCADLVSGGTNGWIRFYNARKGKTLAEFQSMEGDATITAMTTDENNNWLIVANSEGFIAMYDICDFLQGDKNEPNSKLPESDTLSPPCHPRRRRRSSISRERFFSNENVVEIEPPEVMTFHAHVTLINSIDICHPPFSKEQNFFFLTGAVDGSARLFDREGYYVGTFGQLEPWNIYDKSTYSAHHPKDVAKYDAAAVMSRGLNKPNTVPLNTAKALEKKAQKGRFLRAEERWELLKFRLENVVVNTKRKEKEARVRWIQATNQIKQEKKKNDFDVLAGKLRALKLGQHPNKSAPSDVAKITTSRPSSAFGRTNILGKAFERKVRQRVKTPRLRPGLASRRTDGFYDKLQLPTIADTSHATIALQRHRQMRQRSKTAIPGARPRGEAPVDLFGKLGSLHRTNSRTRPLTTPAAIQLEL